MHSIVMQGDDRQNEPFWKKFEVPVSIAAYASCSISMVILNKLMIGTYGFNFPTVLIFFQNLSAVVFVMALKKVGMVDYPELEARKVKRWLPLTFLFVAMLITSLLALRTLSVPVATLIKNLAIITTAVGDKVLFGHTFNAMTLTAFSLLLTGSIMGASTDAWVTFEGLVWGGLNVCSTSAFQLYMKLVLNDLKQEMGRWGPVYYNNVLSLPPLLLPTMFMYSDWVVKAQDLLSNSAVVVVMGVLMVVSAIMTMTSFWCMSATSPTTYSVVGGLNKVPLTVIGIYVFNQFPTQTGTIGIMGALGGGLLYTHAMNQKKAGDMKASPTTQATGRAMFSPR
eukprot:TRINITY_DN9329_c0_g1_i1.p1 TRINITY_DN9329_c0_g1~~TRINITY_DN9329_c0_g1_i1.p1  ORF type:complete len:338 (+),score=118.76 TRINITY_DN9329_c0_g1_i1:42-1055(+)